MKMEKTEHIPDQKVPETGQSTVKTGQNYVSNEDIIRFILVLTVSICAIVLLVGYLITRDIVLLASDLVADTAFAAIVAYYFKR